MMREKLKRPIFHNKKKIEAYVSEEENPSKIEVKRFSEDKIMNEVAAQCCA